MRPFPTEPAVSVLDLLPDARFSDAFSIDVSEPGLDAVSAAERVMGSTPTWVKWLLRVRNAVVRPLGLKGTDDVSRSTADRIGFFPCISRSPERSESAIPVGRPTANLLKSTPILIKPVRLFWCITAS